MASVISACGVLCSGCPAFHGKERGIEHQKKTAAAWKRIFKLNARPETLSCGGCQGPEDELLSYCRKCKTQQCCRKKGLHSCAECPVKSCTRLSKAQGVWDGVPALKAKLSRADFATYARPYCEHRERLEKARKATQRGRVSPR